ncbi:MAG: diaminopimelate epimerase [Verrucomicrobia bacterium]|nr:diaminopimelate epimerase [Verrucomicrobiota bacterium]
MRFHKYHALGNDYIVLHPADFPAWQPAPTTGQIRAVCHRNFGVGSDGILWGPLPSKQSEFGLRIFNPDGSEAEKSGNGLRIFSRFLWDQGLVRNPAFTVETPGGHVQSVIKEQGRLITVAMGSVNFSSEKIPVTGAARDVINEKITVLDREFTFCAATIGNPHCVIPLPDISPEIAHRYGPHLETHPSFPRKTNVQFMKVRDRNNIQIEIWERGAGYTLASGSSSSAAAAVAHKLGLVDRSVTVHMPGGQIAIEIGDNFSILMTGTVNKVAEGTMHPELFAVTV